MLRWILSVTKIDMISNERIIRTNNGMEMSMKIQKKDAVVQCSHVMRRMDLGS